MKLRPGRFYRAKNGAIWCCYRVRRHAPVQAQADCICLEDSRVEYFFIDGRYDEGGQREHTLIAETTDFCRDCSRDRTEHTRGEHPYNPEEL